MASDMTTAEMVEWLRCDATPFINTDRNKFEAIAARLEALDKVARAARAEAIWLRNDRGPLWNDSAKLGQWMRLSSEHDARWKEAGCGE
jgi:hypothetical protein